ncbi:unnamed protein product, partial [Porites lobata]
MSSLTRNKTYTVALEWYQKDEWLFNRSKFSAEGTGELKDNTLLVLYGVDGHVEQVPDVYDDHPIIPSSHTTTETTTTSTGDKKASTLPKSHGTDNLLPLFLSCNLTKSIDGNRTIMKS